MPEFDKVQFVARLLFSLPTNDALQIFRRLSVEDVKTIVDQLQHEASEVALSLDGSFDSASDPISDRSSKVGSSDSRFDFFLHLAPQIRCRVLQDESPAMIAKALSLLEPEPARETMKLLPITTRELTIRKICAQEAVTEKDVTQICSVLKQKLRRILHTATDEVAETQAEIDKIDAKRLKSSLADLDVQNFAGSEPVQGGESRDPSTNNSTSKHSLVGIGRLTQMTDAQVKAVLKQCDTSVWAPAIKNAPVAIQQKVMNCMAPAAVGLLKIEIEKLGNIGPKEEQSARQAVVHTAFRIATSSEFIAERREPKAA